MSLPAKTRATRAGAPSSRPAAAPMPEAELLQVIGSIGPKVRELRSEYGLSLQQLADRSDVSPAAIHKVEQGSMVPTITTLLKLASALNRPVAYFVDEEEPAPAPVTVTRAKDRQPVYTSRQGLDLGGISGPYNQYQLAAAIATVEPHASSGESPLNHAGEELIHLLSGTLEVTVAGQVTRLTTGDSVHFHTDHDHFWQNPTARPARAVWIALRP